MQFLLACRASKTASQIHAIAPQMMFLHGGAAFTAAPPQHRYHHPRL